MIKTTRAAIYIFLLLAIATNSATAQHYDLFYTCIDNALGKDRIARLEPKRGYVSVDIDKEVIIFHNLNDSEIIDLKSTDYNESSREWRLTLPKRDAGDSWDGYLLSLDDKKEPLSLERRYTMKGEGKYFSTLKMGVYRYPSFSLNKEMFATRKIMMSKGNEVPDIRNNEYAWYLDILNTEKKPGHAYISRNGDELVFDESETESLSGLPSYKMKMDVESLVMISKPKYHGMYFNAVNSADTNIKYEIFYGLNYHLDRADPLMEILVYKNNVFDQLAIYGYSHFELFNERDYKPPLPVIVSGCQRCKGKGKIATAEVCRRCHGRGYQKSTVYRSSDQLIKTEIHNDGSRTNTYLKQGFSSNVYDCDLCNGTGHKLETCPACSGKGKIETRGYK